MKKYRFVSTLLILLLFVAAQGALLSHEVSHNQPLKKHHDQHCVLCFSANLQSQIFIAPDLAFVAAIFCLIFIARIFDRTKLSYLLSSKSPRAPPVIS